MCVRHLEMACPGFLAPTPGGTEDRRREGVRGGRGTHRGSVGTGHSWEAWFTQGTLEQTRHT